MIITVKTTAVPSPALATSIYFFRCFGSFNLTAYFPFGGRGGGYFPHLAKFRAYFGLLLSLEDKWGGGNRPLLSEPSALPAVLCGPAACFLSVLIGFCLPFKPPK